MRFTQKLLVSLMVRQNWKLKHSVIIPLANNDEVQQQFLKFRQFVLTECKGMNEELLQCPKQLHITICSFDTNSEYEVLKSRVLLKHCYEKSIKPLLNEKPLIVEMKGLHVLKGIPHKAHILCAKVDDPTNRLQTIANSIIRQFNDCKLINDCQVEKYPNIKLHVTFMNSDFPQRIVHKRLKSLSEAYFVANSGLKYYEVFDDFKLPKRESFDATKILNQYSDRLFCHFSIRSIELNQKYNFRSANILELLELPNQLSAN